jgi:predicted glycogen debranching enzyme
MNEWVLRLPWSGKAKSFSDPPLNREWLATNALGGYASGTVAGVASRRYHGLLIAALPTPLGRYVMFNHLSELVRLPDGTRALLGCSERSGGALEVDGTVHLTEFRLDLGMPVWLYRVQDVLFEKRVLLPHRQNTVHIQYRLLEGKGPVRLKLRPSLHFRPLDGPVDTPQVGPYRIHAEASRYEIQGEAPLPPLRMHLAGERAAFTLEAELVRGIYYRLEAERGYPAEGSLWSPGYFRVDLAAGRPATLVASTETWEAILALSADEALAAERARCERLLHAADPALHTAVGVDLVLAADQFLITPAGRVEDAARARASGDEVRSVIAGYHWFTDWGRDTMISLEGLTLATGRQVEAGYILRTFAYYIRDGMLPNLFPEGEKEGLYHTADATLWFFHAIDRYLAATDDRETLRLLLPKLHDIVHHHRQGTHFGIQVDPRDGLLRQGAAGYQLTWMDAKVGDWVVTPRRGKAVEINALWYNALRLLERWTQAAQEQGPCDPSWASAASLAEEAERVRRSFSERFWYNAGGHLYDVVDGEQGDDPACRPNQILAISLPNPVLDPARWAAVLRVVHEQLWTPLGLRSLAPGHPDYKSRYDGDLRARDAAYHQGTVWAWLIGPFIDAWIKVHPHERVQARHFLDRFVKHLEEACIGSISEVFDAEEPYTPRGCIAQAWSVAEVLRSWVRTAQS